MKIEEIAIGELKPADYNPRKWIEAVELTGFDPGEFENIMAMDNETNPKEQVVSEESFRPEYPTHHYAINRMRTAIFFSLRRFTSKNKKKQIATILRYKDILNRDFIDMVAGDFYVFISSMFGNINDFCITNLPPGNNKGGAFHLATEVGMRLAEKLGLGYLPIFDPYLKKNHNPCDSSLKMRLLLKHIDIPGNIILIDDVSTTGTSMESAMNRLKEKSRMIIPVVWVMGEVRT